MKIQYHALFVNDVQDLKRIFPSVHPNEFYHHSTIEFAPKNMDNIEVGKTVPLKIVGRITTNRVDALLVENPKSKNKYPHITLSTAVGVKPYESNAAFELNPTEIVMLPVPFTIPSTEGYFNGEDVTKLK